MKWIFALILVALAAFCLFGFLASFEPGVKSAMMFRFVYAIAGIACLAGVGWIVLRRNHTPRNHTP